MPVRTIPPNPRSVTGRLPATAKHPAMQYESTLERDFLRTLRTDPSVQRVEEQPLRVTYTDRAGKQHHYTPDVFVGYTAESGRPPTLFEVKHFDTLKTDRDALRDGFVAAAHYARERGWRFRIVTERTVRGHRSPEPQSAASVDSGLDGASIAAQHVARERFEAIRPLLAERARGSAAVRTRAQALGVHANSLYRWLERYDRGGGRLSALLPTARRDRGCPRLEGSVEALVGRAINEHFLNAQRRSIPELYEYLVGLCRAAGMSAPHLNTVRARVNAVDFPHRAHARHGSAAARRLEPLRGEFQSDAPLAVVQLDHMLLDVMVVDETERRAIGRPWLTLAFDVHSRMVLGFYLSLEAPGALSVGVCLSNAILPKESWLQRVGVTASWPCSGVMRCLHMDNAREFRGEMLRQACDEYGVELMFRPLARPQYGGHIERLLGTLARRLHSLRGSTFSNAQERGEYDSEAQAALTLNELERWLLGYIIEIYHQRVHSSLGTAPQQRWLECRGGTPPYAPTVDERERVRLAFLPCERRTVQRHGVRWDGILYANDSLKPFVYARDPTRAALRRRFVFKRDPRDISVIYFLEPEGKRYIPVSCRRTDRPGVSLWEYRAAQRRLREQGRAQVNEDAVFAALERLRTLERDATDRTRSVRRDAQRRRQAGSARAAFIADLPAPSVPAPDHAGWVKHVEPFEEIVAPRASSVRRGR